MKINFTETVSHLYGPILTAEVKVEDRPIKFKIVPDLFCREWFEVSFELGEDRKVIGRYISNLDQAKELCENQLQKLSH